MKGWGRKITITVNEEALDLVLVNAQSGVDSLVAAYDGIMLDPIAELMLQRDAVSLRLVQEAVKASKARRRARRGGT